MQIQWQTTLKNMYPVFGFSPASVSFGTRKYRSKSFVESVARGANKKKGLLRCQHFLLVKSKLPPEKDTGITQKRPTGQQSKPKSSKEKIIKYTDKKNGFSVMHPERWKPNDTHDGALYSVVEKEDVTGTCAMAVQKSEVDIRKIEDIFMDALSKEIDGKMRIISSKKYSHEIGSISAHLVESIAFVGDNNIEAHSLYAVFPEEGSTYIVIGMCGSALENSKKILHDAVYSFRLLK